MKKTFFAFAVIIVLAACGNKKAAAPAEENYAAAPAENYYAAIERYLT